MSSKKTEKVEKNNISEPDTGISNANPPAIEDVGTDVKPVLEQVAGDMSKPSGGVNIDEITGRIDAMKKTDVRGTIFDATIHSVDDTGEPRLTKTGNYRRKRKSALPEVSTSRKAAEYSALAFFQLGIVIFGDEWMPDEKTNEKGMVVDAFDDYYAEKEIIDIPAWLGLAIALGGYSTKRFVKPETKTKMSSAKSWFVKKVKGLRNKLPKKAAKVVTKYSATDDIPTG